MSPVREIGGDRSLGKSTPARAPMRNLTAEDMAGKLMADRIQSNSPDAQALSDPIADTPVVVTLDELRPYDLNPRITRNPRYEDIKASIRARGLDAPPAITRRPGEAHYIIRNGGNTRLSILRELWTETKDERFFRIACLFRPWSARGEIVALTGHLAENELHGGLSFIERALGVEKARELYEQECGEQLTQAELARRLTADGYPVTQPHISRMQDAVRYLLPAIPSVLYAGLGKPQIERLIVLRRSAARTWERHAQHSRQAIDFSAFFESLLATFDGEELATFDYQRIQDELIGQMADLLRKDYDALALEMFDAEVRQHALAREPTSPLPSPPAAQSPREHIPTAARAPKSDLLETPPSHRTSSPASPADPAATAASHSSTSAGIRMPERTERESATSDTQRSERLQAHIVSPADTTERLQAIQRTLANATGDVVPDFEANVVRAIPVQAGGLHPISDIWYIEPALDVPDRLRSHIAQLAREIAQEAGLADQIDHLDDGIGFACAGAHSSAQEVPPFLARAVLALLGALSGGYLRSPRPTAHAVRLADDLGPLLQGMAPSPRAPRGANRLSDAGVVKLFRLIRLARRLVEVLDDASDQ